jgi:hypothetical protein
LHDEVNYHITERGLEIEATWRLQDAAGVPRELSVALPPGVQLVSAQSNGLELPWRVARDSLSSSVARIDLSAAAPSRRLEVVLRAWHPLVIDQAWILPKLRPAGVFWTSGTVALTVDPQFELRGLTLTECVENAVRGIGAHGSDPEIHTLSALSATANVEALIARRLPEAIVHLGASLTHADPEMKGRVVARWKVNRDSVHRLSGQIAPDWTVESVETVPAEALGEWFVDQHNVSKHIEIQLAQALTPSRDVSVILTGRLQQYGLNKTI